MTPSKDFAGRIPAINFWAVFKGSMVREGAKNPTLLFPREIRKYAEVAAVVKTVNRFQELGRILAKVANSGAVVGKHAADRPDRQQRKRDRRKEGGGAETEKDGQGRQLVGHGHRKKPSNFCFAIR